MYIYTNLPANTIGRLPHHRSGDSEGQKTCLAHTHSHTHTHTHTHIYLLLSRYVYVYLNGFASKHILFCKYT